MLSNLFAVFIGGGLGSIARFGLSVLIVNHFRSVFPVATLLSNVLSCFVLALVIYFAGEKLNTEMPLRLLLITGFCGGFSTFSAFSYETVQLIRNGNLWYAAINIIVNIIICFAIIFFLTKSVNR